jgi:hypothetical protein
MGVQVKWADEAQTVLEYTFSDPWGWEDYYNSIDKAQQLMDGVSGKVTSIIDLSKSKGLPPGAMTHLRRVGRENPNQGTVILVGMNLFIRTFANVLMRFYPKAAEKARLVATLEEAYTVIGSKPRR